MKRRLIPLFATLGLAASAWGGSISATVQWAQRVALTVPVSGVIDRVSVDVGDRVKSGHELLRLDPTPFEAVLRGAKARQKRASAEYEEAKRALQRALELYDRGALATVELDHAKLRQTQAYAEHETTEAALQRARYRLRRSRLLAPFDGWVIERRATVGQTVASRLQPPVLLVLGEDGRYLARALLPLSVARRLQRGAEVAVLVNQKRYRGTVQSVGLEPAPDKSDSRYLLEVIFSAEGLMTIGVDATVEWP